MITLYILIGLSFFSSALLAFWVMRLNALLKKPDPNITDLTSSLASLQQDVSGCRNELDELRAGTLGMGVKLKDLDSKLAHTDSAIKAMQEQQQELMQQDPEIKLYTQANKLVQSGATVEELMQECDIPRAEAELLISIHRKG
ncbi:DUF2802 domain-containing protein [Aestuariibacter sp. AA17]|uniref:DUF2802 domain-containing protein n=1 Tax=Fluctibacter corallii TaxID=2984329 RepID=A0ABT3A3E6_9ALTE|nr:DUF2802 domain-containing protein [Aestuariibacter sp. AA17]MCV2883178.1 DUF2802 domain-containing protein [Aestuariibacter sp. AA17]